MARVFSVSREQRTEPDVEWVFGLFRRRGSIDFARAALRQMIEAATREFEIAYRDAPPSADRDFLHALIGFLGDRAV
jgi:geranylgeranyl diphosphate synthase type II